MHMTHMVSYLLLILCAGSGQCADHSYIIKMGAATITSLVNAFPQTCLMSLTLQMPHVNWACSHPILVPAEPMQTGHHSEVHIQVYINITPL